MKYLVDTSVWTQRLLGQIDAAEADAFLRGYEPQEFAITVFAWHSIGATCTRRDVSDLFIEFTQDVIAPERVHLLLLRPADMAAVINAVQEYGLDFDDAYQFVAAEKAQPDHRRPRPGLRPHAPRLQATGGSPPARRR